MRAKSLMLFSAVAALAAGRAFAQVSTGLATQVARPPGDCAKPCSEPGRQPPATPEAPVPGNPGLRARRNRSPGRSAARARPACRPPSGTRSARRTCSSISSRSARRGSIPPTTIRPVSRRPSRPAIRLPCRRPRPTASTAFRPISLSATSRAGAGRLVRRRQGPRCGQAGCAAALGARPAQHRAPRWTACCRRTRNMPRSRRRWR